MHSIAFNARRYSTRPYKWMRFVTVIIIGAIDVLSPECGDSPCPQSCDYDLSGDLPEQSLDLYYHTSDEEKKQMVPIDPDFVRENISVTHPSLCAPNFRRNVSARDGARCVLTEKHSDICDAAHIVPVGKGDEVCRAARPGLAVHRA